MSKRCRANKHGVNTAPVRLIASDLDGTLLAANGQLSARTLGAIEAAAKAGIVFAAATGRSHISAAPRLAPASPFMRWAICSNGASLYDLHEHRVVAQHVIADHHLTELHSLWDSADFALGWEDIDGFGADEAYQRRFPHGLADIVPRDRPPASGVLKILVSHATLTGRTLLDHVRAAMPAALEVATSGAPFVEITGAGVNKAYGVSTLADQLGIDASETLVFGDNNNDLPMFAWAGRAVAMANATQEVQQAATAVTSHHDDDGVARAVEALLAG
jgi:Cof subfamily protein (haloacid dehalogenase superfamily)